MNLRNKRQSKIIKKVIIFAIAVMIMGLSAYFSLEFLRNQQIANEKKQAEIARIAKIKAAEAIAAAKEAKRKEPVYISLPGSKTIRAIVDDYSITSSIWAIVSKTHSISTDYAPTPLVIPAVATRTDKSNDERSIRSDIEKPLVDMFKQAEADGYSLMIGSGYRPASLQKIYFDNYARTAGVAAANQSIAFPGQSEHQTGLAVDISTVARNCYISECFADTPDGQWLFDNSYKFGFTLRYPKGKEPITGYNYEPWHYRYVGIDLATALHESGLTLDEAWPYLEKADATLRQNGAI